MIEWSVALFKIQENDDFDIHVFLLLFKEKVLW